MTLPQDLRSLRWLALLGAAALGCDFSVTNPGRTEDQALNDASARRAIVTGAQRALQIAMQANQGDVWYHGAAISFELNPAGSTGSFGIPTAVQDGRLREEDNHWSQSTRARWVAEDAIRRFTETGAPEDSLFATAYLWAGYANRLLGENFCNAVIDGGPEEPRTVFFTRAEGHFTEANRIAAAAGKANLALAALAGRASVRADLATFNNNDAAIWASAAADAAAVADTFRWQLTMSSQDQDQYNGLYWAQAGTPYKAHTQWATFYDGYTRSTPADTRVSMLIRLQAENTTLATATAAGATSVTLADAAELDTGLRTDAWLVVDTEDGGSKEVRQVASVSGNTVTLRSPLSQAYAAGLEVRLAQLGDAAVGKFGGNVPHFPQQKYTATTAGVNFSSGWEMRLIQAEEALVRSQVGEAVGYMNQRRNDLTGLGQIPVGTLAEAWTALKAERAFELWLEARRLGDLSRWAAAGTPGTTFDGVWLDTNGDGVDEQVESMTIPSARSLCFPVGRSEKETNCNYLGTC